MLDIAPCDQPTPHGQTKLSQPAVEAVGVDERALARVAAVQVVE